MRLAIACVNGFCSHLQCRLVAWSTMLLSVEVYQAQRHNNLARHFRLVDNFLFFAHKADNSSLRQSQLLYLTRFTLITQNRLDMSFLCVTNCTNLPAK
jgi:hypothetical protein